MDNDAALQSILFAIKAVIL